MDKPIVRSSGEEANRPPDEGASQPPGGVSGPRGTLSRQEREAAALRENLRRRKEQARAREKTEGT